MHPSHAHGYTPTGASVSDLAKKLPNHLSGVSGSPSGQAFSHVLASALAHSGALVSSEGKATVSADGGHGLAQFAMADVIARIRSTHEKGSDSDLRDVARTARWITNTPQFSPPLTTSGHIQGQSRSGEAFQGNAHVRSTNRPAHDGTPDASGAA
jgi:hypothetical protein